MQWIMLIFAFVIIIHLITGKTAVNKLVSLNVLSGVVLAFLVLHGVQLGRTIYLDIALVYDIFGFLGFLAISHLLNKSITGGKNG
ncbi:monovalent cation/H+ antiporter complex subunit F [Oceanispirochaeta crateris]|nr:monovalent cation/H+ antiporter complex subunit F [Oceanispirochaeta crateris]